MSFIIQSVTILLEGIVSFFSPCVIPLLPIYMGYLAGSAKEKDQDGNIIYQRKRVFLYTLLFVLGISMSFFLLGLSFTAIGNFFKETRTIIAIIGGIIILLLGLFQLKVIKLPFLQKEKKLNVKINPKKMNPVMAFIMGFLFSFAWTPCVGPALSSVLIMAGSADSMLLGNLLVLIYAIGFIIPFLILGLFTREALNFLKRKQNILTKAVQLGGILLILAGTYTVITNVNTWKLQTSVTNENCKINKETGLATCPGRTPSQSNNQQEVSHIERFSLIDQNNQQHNWEDYKDKTVLLHFWSTDCSACKKELNELQELYEHYEENEKDVALLTVVSPQVEGKSQKQIKSFIESKDITFPVLIDQTGEFFLEFNIVSFPNTFIVKDSEIRHTIPGATTADNLIEAVEKVKKNA
ncbi:MAG TPA: redoxin domain-containing protein [Candidatus Scybalousia intestinigallinarum]|nr:redoxin domain-containing protein [Candidatus Scybalousia intestinigallinarum]